jgi:PAS domain-containing protein
MPAGVLATHAAVVAMAVVTIAAVWFATHAMVERATARELEDTRHELENYARTLASHIERAIGTVDRSLLAIKRDAERGRRVWSGAELALEHRAHGDFVSVLTVADARGAVVASSISASGVNLAGRQHFVALKEKADAGLVLGPPVRGQASGIMTMHAARRLDARDGTFKGIVSAGLNLDHFAGFYRGIDLGSGGAVEVIGFDGLPRIGEAAPDAASARVARYTSLLDRVRRGETRGTDTGVAGPDGAPLIRSHYALDGYPLVVTVAKSEAGALQGIVQYRRHAYAYAAGITLLILALLGSSHFLLRRQRGTQAALSGSESRFRALTDLTSDWYWETDAEYRFTLMSAGIAHWRTRVPADYLGRRRWELAFLAPLDGGWERHQETVQARQPFRDFVVRHIDPDGNVGYASVSGEPVTGTDGRHGGYRGVGRDVTAETRLQQRLKLQHRVSAILANARSPETAVTEVLRTACETFDWQWGARRLTDGTSLSCGETWCVPELECSAFARTTRETVYPNRPGGVVERALVSGEPQWVSGEGGGMARRMPIAAAAGLRMLITVPVSCGGHAIGALEFSSNRLERPDALLSGTLRVLGEMVGQFLQRQSEMEQRHTPRRCFPRASCATRPPSIWPRSASSTPRSTATTSASIASSARCSAIPRRSSSAGTARSFRIPTMR